MEEQRRHLKLKETVEYLLLELQKCKTNADTAPEVQKLKGQNKQNYVNIKNSRHLGKKLAKIKGQRRNF